MVSLKPISAPASSEHIPIRTNLLARQPPTWRLKFFRGTACPRPPPGANPMLAFRVDARTMDRWGLKQQDLPPGSIVLFKEPSLWNEHRNFVLATLFVLGLQSLFVVALLVERQRRRQAEISLKESEERMTFTAASLNIGLWQFDRTTNEVWATEHCSAMFGLPGDVPLTSDTLVAAIHPEDREMAI